MPSKLNRAVSAEQAVEGLAALHATAMGALRLALDRFVAKRSPPSPDERSRFRYPELRLIWDPHGPLPFTWRAWAKFQLPGTYATIEIGVGNQEIPYPYVFEKGDELVHGDVSAAELARYFPAPILSAVGDEVADGAWVFEAGRPRPLALFDAARVDYSLRRLVHYTRDHSPLLPPPLLTAHSPHP